MVRSGLASTVSTHDRLVLDQGTKVLKGHWGRNGHWVRETFGNGILNPDASGTFNPALPLNPDPNNPAHFIRAKDPLGDPMHVILDGHGSPFDPEPIDFTGECEQCDPLADDATAFGTPTIWHLTGLEALRSETINLQHVSGCIWTAAVTATNGVVDNYRLEATADKWVFTARGGNWATNPNWEAEFENWDCYGPNSLFKVIGGANVPDEVFVEMLQTAKPGERLIERYKGGNFLRLGIPLSW